MFVIFDTVNVYYLPQYRPIIDELLLTGHKVILVCYTCNVGQSYSEILADSGAQVTWVEDENSAAKLYSKLAPDWIFFGNSFKYLKSLNRQTKTAQLGHGIGPKPSYYHKSSTPMGVRFIEGAGRLKKIKELYPSDNFVQVGFSKLDPIFNGQERGLDLKVLGLDVSKQTILYAPTFNPSSLECFPDDWPKDFANYNILIKPHTFTYTVEQYKKQRKKLKKWTAFNNVHLAAPEEISLLPYMKTADILLSEASSTLFEFAALNKPVIVCDFFKLKWSYRGPFKYRFKRRFGTDNVLYKDIGLHVKAYKDLLSAIPQQLTSLDQYADNRAMYTKEHVGLCDGKVSERIVSYIEQ